MTRQLLIAGGGLGGLAAAIAAARAGWQARVFEQAPVFGEAGAGIQLGPNATRVLQGWGLGEALAACAARPQALRVRDAGSGRELASMALGNSIEQRYGAPYATVHRADLHALLLAAARAAGAQLFLSARVEGVRDTGSTVELSTVPQGPQRGEALVGADGLWSEVRRRIWADGPPRATGHLAWRTLLRQADLSAGARSADVTVWLGQRLHAVAYPVRGGEALNLVVIVEGDPGEGGQEWDQPGSAQALRSSLGAICAGLDGLVGAAPGWGLWVLNEREPLAGPDGMARGRIALLGDAAHPMRPYLAQGAGMALEDAAQLERSLAQAGGGDVAPALAGYAAARWERAARVQRRAVRNGKVFHATGITRLARDLALRTAGSRLLDLPWLFQG